MLNLSFRWALAIVLVSAAARADDRKPRTDLQGDALPDGALARLGSARLRHGDPVTFTAFLPGGKTLISASADWTVRVWDLAGGKELRRMTHADDVVAAQQFARARRSYPLHACMSADGKLLATALTNGRTVRLWDLASGKQLRQFNATLSGAINSLAVSPDGKTVAVSSSDSKIRLYESASGKEIRILGVDDPQGRMIFVDGSAGMNFSPDGKQLVVSGMEFDNGNIKRGLKVWDVAGGKVQYRIDADANRVVYAGSSVFSPDGKTLAWGTWSGEINLADPATGKVRRTIKSRITRLDSVAFAPDGKTVLAHGMHDGAVGVWDVESGKELLMVGKPAGMQELLRPRVSSPYGTSAALAVAPDGKRVACIDANIVRLIDLATGKDALASPGHRGPVFGIHYSRDGKSLVTQGFDNTVRLWNAEGKETGQIQVPATAYTFSLSADAKWIVTEGMDGSVRVWDAATGKEKCRVAIGQLTRLSRYAFSPDGKSLAVRGRSDPVTHVYSTETGKLLATLGKAEPIDPMRGRVYMRTLALAFSPDGRLLATSGAQGGITLWEVASGYAWREIAPAIGVQARDLAFSTDGRSLAVDFNDNSVRLFEVATGEERRHYVRKGEKFDPTAASRTVGYSNSPYHGTTLALSADGRRLALAGEGRLVQVWDTLTGEEVGRLAGHEGEIAALAFGPDGKTLASAGEDGLGLIWDAAALKSQKKLAETIDTAAFEKRWLDLQSANGDRPFDAVCALSAAGASAIPLLDARLKPSVPAGAGQIDRLIADLDARRFAVRKKALDELERLGPLAAPALKKVLEGKPSEELRKRAEELLAKAKGQTLSPAQLQFVRAIEVLERIATAEAKAVLERLAKGAAGALETTEARTALDRLR